MANINRVTRMCRIGERDNINSRYANSDRDVRGNINGEVPVIPIVSTKKTANELPFKNFSITRLHQVQTEIPKFHHY